MCLGTISYTLSCKTYLRIKIHITIRKHWHKIFNVFTFLLYKIFENQINHKDMFPSLWKLKCFIAAAITIFFCKCVFWSMAKWMDKQQWERIHNGKSFCLMGTKYKCLSFLYEIVENQKIPRCFFQALKVGALNGCCFLAKKKILLMVKRINNQQWRTTHNNAITCFEKDTPWQFLLPYEDKIQIFFWSLVGCQCGSMEISEVVYNRSSQAKKKF